MPIICVLFAFLISDVSIANDNNAVSAFFRLSTSEQMQTFRNYSLEDQYSIFLFGNRFVHPPALYLARPFAEQGSRIVPFLKTKLESATDETTIRDITNIFAELASQKVYDFSNDLTLLHLLEQKANGMKGIWKESTMKMITEIKNQKL